MERPYARTHACTHFCKCHFVTFLTQCQYQYIQTISSLVSFSSSHWWSTMRESPRGLQPFRFSSPRTYVDDVSSTLRCRLCTPNENKLQIIGASICTYNLNFYHPLDKFRWQAGYTFVLCFFFPEIKFDISCKLYPDETICMKCQTLLPGKKLHFKLLSFEIFPNMLSIK